MDEGSVPKLASCVYEKMEVTINLYNRKLDRKKVRLSNLMDV